jgi:hypothetical protein
MKKCRIILKALLLAASFCSLLRANLFAQSTHFLLTQDLNKSPLTHTVFHGSNRHYETTPSFSGANNFSAAFLSDVGRPDCGPYPWKYNIVATVFWVGEQAAEGNPIPNTESAWDPSWVINYGGEDSPVSRTNFIPVSFVPRQNPFYVALPYNDVDEHHTKSEAAKVIPWFNDSFVRDGQSVCKGRWVAIRHGKRVCYAQWEDVGPFQVDHWQYVFGNDRPRPNSNHDAGIDVSPAVRDYLGMSGMDVCDWKFVSSQQIPNGPWALYGDTNSVARLRNQSRIPGVTGRDALPRDPGLLNGKEPQRR